MALGIHVAVAALTVLGLAGCEKAARAEHADDEGPGRPVTAAEFKAAGKTWPLTVPEARVGCDAPGALFVLFGGKKYGLNDWAARKDGYVDLGEIRSEAKKGSKAPTADLVMAARTACEW